MGNWACPICAPTLTRFFSDSETRHTDTDIYPIAWKILSETTTCLTFPNITYDSFNTLIQHVLPISFSITIYYMPTVFKKKTKKKKKKMPTVFNFLTKIIENISVVRILAHATRLPNESLALLCWLVAWWLKASKVDRFQFSTNKFSWKFSHKENITVVRKKFDLYHAFFFLKKNAKSFFFFTNKCLIFIFFCN